MIAASVRKGITNSQHANSPDALPFILCSSCLRDLSDRSYASWQYSVIIPMVQPAPLMCGRASRHPTLHDQDDVSYSKRQNRLCSTYQAPSRSLPPDSLMKHSLPLMMFALRGIVSIELTLFRKLNSPFPRVDHIARIRSEGH